MRGCFAGHMPHGTAKNRQYLDRHKMFNSNLSVTRNKCGIYEWNDPLNNEIMLEYFKSRNEDNLTEQEFIKPHMDDKTFSLFASLVAEASNYVEYGCGGSTSYAFLNSSARIISVDTDKSWIDMVLNFMPGNLERVELCHIDMGEVGEWGFPKVETDGTAYVSWPWTRSNDADLILVDGRFRVACAVKSMIESKPGTPIIFEDYFGRNFYLGIEKLITPECRYGRSALFRVPASIDKNLAELILKKHIKDAR
jgi:hypothetical protein